MSERYSYEEMGEALHSTFYAAAERLASAGNPAERVMEGSSRAAGELFGRRFEGDWAVTAALVGAATEAEGYFFLIEVAPRGGAGPALKAHAAIPSRPSLSGSMHPRAAFGVADVGFLNGLRHARLRRNEMEELVE